MPEDSGADAGPRERIQQLNDRLRVEGVGGRLLITRGIQALGPERVAEIVTAVRSYDAFTPDNDPYGEHDFGNMEIANNSIFFKIDYYDAAGLYGSEDPADPRQTTRVLTILLAEEY